MATKTEEVIGVLAKELRYSEEVILEKSLKAFLERQLRQVKAEILLIAGKYHVTSVEGMEARYQKGTLEEKDTWRDLQQLDHLEYRRDRLTQLLEELE